MELTRIEEIKSGKRRYMPLLLIGDESEDMVEKYLDRGRLFVGMIGDDTVAVTVVTEETDGWVEVRNLAVDSEFRRRGIGHAMLAHVESLYPGHDIRLGTGETPSTLRFYKSCGYRISHTIPDFFTDNYDHPIIEEGVMLRDMIYLSKRI